MTEASGWHGRYLMVNLTEQTSRALQIDPVVMRQFVGGRGLGSYLLYTLLDRRIDGLDPDNPLIFSVGPLVGLRENVLGATRMTVSAISPLTGILGDANSGGDVGYEIRTNGYDGLIITGRLEKPGLLHLANGGVEILDAGPAWGKTVTESCEYLRKQFPAAVISCIGPAGENLVRYAAIVNEPFRLAGRCGLGAVMGSKKLKAILVRRSGCFPRVHDSRGLRCTLSSAVTREKTKHLSYWEMDGTLQLVEILDLFKRIPARYWSSTDIPYVNDIRARAFDQIQDCVKVGGACNVNTGCVLSCTGHFLPLPSYARRILKLMRGIEKRWIHRYPLLRPVKRLVLRLLKDPLRGPEYEGVGCWAGLCGIRKATEAFELNHLCNNLGLDVISTANVIAFAIKCRELHASARTALPFDIGWGDFEKIARVVLNIGLNKENGPLLSTGVKRLAEQLGNESARVAVHTKGLEWEASELRPWIGGLLAHAVSSRGGDHERGMPILEMTWYLKHGREPVNSSKLAEEEMLTPYVYERKEVLVKLYEDHKVLLDSLGICHFYSPLKLESISASSGAVYSANHLLDLLYCATGLRMSNKDVSELGDRVISMERQLNLRQGLKATDDNCPSRFAKEPVEFGGNSYLIDQSKMEELVRSYYRLRGWC